VITHCETVDQDVAGRQLPDRSSEERRKDDADSKTSTSVTKSKSQKVWFSFSGVFNIWQKGGHGERAEREPITGSRGRAPGRGAETFFAFEYLMDTANSPIFLKFGNAKDHQTLLNFAILARKWQKTHLFI